MQRLKSSPLLAAGMRVLTAASASEEPMTPNQFCYHVWLAHRMLPHGQRPTKKHVDVARYMARWQHHSPSHAKLARAAGVCVRTVQNALTRLRSLGMLAWTHQRRLTRWSGWLRRANRYTFHAFSLLLVPAPKKEGNRILNPESTLGKLEKAALLVKWGLA
jgi:hypothetical protein